MLTKRSVLQTSAVPPVALSESLSRDQFRLYQLSGDVLRRRMAPAKYETTSVKIGADQYIYSPASRSYLTDLCLYTQTKRPEKGNVLNQSLKEE